MGRTILNGRTDGEVVGVGGGVGGGGGVGATGTGSRPTTVVAVEESSAGLGSGTVDVTLAVLTALPGSRPAETATVTVTESPGAMLPKLHVTTPPAWLQLPCPGVAEANDTAGPSVSVKLAPVA